MGSPASCSCRTAFSPYRFLLIAVLRKHGLWITGSSPSAHIYGLPLAQQADIRSPGKPEYLCFLACVRPRPGWLAVMVGTSDAEHGGRSVLTELPYIQPLADVSRSQVLLGQLVGCLKCVAQAMKPISTQSHVGYFEVPGSPLQIPTCVRMHEGPSFNIASPNRPDRNIPHWQIDGGFGHTQLALE